MDRGELVPDDVMIEIIAERIGHPDTAKGFILDGFPRTVAQAEALDALLDKRGLSLDAIIEITVDEQMLIDRIAGRAKETGRHPGRRPVDRDAACRSIASRRRRLPTTIAARESLVTVDGMGTDG